MATKKLLIKKKNKNQYKDFSSNVSIYSFYGCFRTYAVKVYPQQTPKNLGASSFAVMLDPFWKKTVVVSLWNDHATNVGQELLDNADKFPIVAIKSLKVGDFQVVSLSTLSESIVLVNPDTRK
ncbi:hypothetical protein VitviT2T_006020 [Vitis vinifera]|uniref:Replication protein A OB domain-containing protein n=1 Tax=Vitis vinifera TaxID=29760 RepID=A0ABY9BUI4_VITVI|nr:hypothetical protein VitviT2T_006020 [Vitis vinifera]